MLIVLDTQKLIFSEYLVPIYFQFNQVMIMFKRHYQVFHPLSPHLTLRVLHVPQRQLLPLYPTNHHHFPLFFLLFHLLFQLTIILSHLIWATLWFI